MALFPPSSRMVRPNRACTASLMRRPILVLPVKEIRSKRLSLMNSSPTVAPEPTMVDAMAPGSPLRLKTFSNILVTAMVTKLVVEAPFLQTKSVSSSIFQLKKKSAYQI